MEEAKDFNKYTSKVNFAPITDFYLKWATYPISKGFLFADKMNPAN